MHLHYTFLVQKTQFSFALVLITIAFMMKYCCVPFYNYSFLICILLKHIPSWLNVSNSLKFRPSYFYKFLNRAELSSMPKEAISPHQPVCKIFHKNQAAFHMIPGLKLMNLKINLQIKLRNYF